MLTGNEGKKAERERVFYKRIATNDFPYKMGVKEIDLLENPAVLFCHQTQYKLYIKLHISPCIITL